MGGELGATVFTNRLGNRDISTKVLFESPNLSSVWQPLREDRSGQRTLAAMLLRAQEEERSRIARELHDDIAQQLALICIDINRIRISNHPGEGPSELDAVVKRVKELGCSIRTLSHELHSPQLDILGLASATSIFCREFGKAHDIDVTCECAGLPDRVPSDISLCLYRITQEALQNVAKHSRAKRVLVKICADKIGILLRIQDFGCGFHVESARCSTRLGLRSMCERIRSVGGNVVIHSKPGEGTTIEARVEGAFHSQA